MGAKGKDHRGTGSLTSEAQTDPENPLIKVTTQEFPGGLRLDPEPEAHSDPGPNDKPVRFNFSFPSSHFRPTYAPVR